MSQIRQHLFLFSNYRSPKCRVKLRVLDHGHKRGNQVTLRIKIVLTHRTVYYCSYSRKTSLNTFFSVSSKSEVCFLKCLEPCICIPITEIIHICPDEVCDLMMTRFNACLCICGMHVVSLPLYLWAGREPPAALFTTLTPVDEGLLLRLGLRPSHRESNTRSV